MEIVTVDIGGTNARFAIAEVADGRVTRLDDPVVFKTAAHASLEMVWQAFGEKAGHALPKAVAIAIAGPVHGDTLRLTNSSWIIQPSLIPARLDVDAFILINDFAAIGHAVAHAGEADFRHLCGPDQPLPATGVISILGPGTGLGVAHLLRCDGGYHVSETEGGHIDHAPIDEVEDAILGFLRARYRRVSVERIVSGPGLANIYEALGRLEGRSIRLRDDAALWQAALDGSDSPAVTALDRFCLSLGSVAGDIALAHGASAVVIAGGLGLRLADRLPHTGFQQRFTAKGRFEKRMAGIPVKVITHPQPGLFGAGAAFAGGIRTGF